ncbi:MAG TPA: hypothetical protein VMU87_01835 [Stellaceae bacterium]|nr:hypothetical protein [Stellaceae bacterium]
MALIGRLAWLAFAAALLLPGAAMADMNQSDASKAWREADNCTHEAFRKFPDYTRESNAKREVARLSCLRNHGLPGSDGGAAPAATATGSK